MKTWSQNRKFSYYVLVVAMIHFNQNSWTQIIFFFFTLTMHSNITMYSERCWNRAVLLLVLRSHELLKIWSYAYFVFSEAAESSMSNVYISQVGLARVQWLGHQLLIQAISLMARNRDWVMVMGKLFNIETSNI